VSDANAVEDVPFPGNDNYRASRSERQRTLRSPGLAFALSLNCLVMVIDFHTHVFPPWAIQGREELLRTDPTFAQLYGNPRSRMATAPDLLASMERAGVEASVVLGFAWRDQELCRRHNDYLLEWATRSRGRLVPFCTVNPSAAGAWQEVERCAAAGARGLGELRPDDQGWELAGATGKELAEAARHLQLILLFHVSEPVGHRYPGKEGLSLTDFYRFAVDNPDLTVVGAHLGGGLPFFAPMPEVAEVCRRLYFDTAAVPLLYTTAAYDLVDHDRLLFGSDYPLLGQERALSSLPDRALAHRWSENAARLLGCGQ